ncbi:hypothetical protein [Ruegeria halocynthiae]|uniref:hypothetical protein n=1 Tax=Ruegeria halocynthiae TaxID=985054 RepID=UPI00056A1753|nr:hypothetical protein [Ruegeria halocynthiae]
MSKTDNLPRVRIKKKKGHYHSFSLNFGKSYSTVQNEELENLLKLCDDWTAFAISFLDFIPLLTAVGYFQVDQNLDSEVVDYLRSVAISHEENLGEADDESELSFIIHEDSLEFVTSRLKTTRHMLRAAKTLRKSVLGSLISEFDFLLLRFLEICAVSHPEKFVDFGEQVTLGEIKDYQTIQELVEERARKKISMKLRESHTDVIDWVMRTFSITSDLTGHKSDQIFRDFIEVCQRRHLIAHNGGIVNELYLNNCQRAGLKSDALPNIGEEVKLDGSYLRKSATRVYLTGYYILQMYMQKYFRNDFDEISGNMLGTSHDFLVNGYTKICQRICEFAEKSSKKLDNETKLSIAVNRALCELHDPKKNSDEQLAAANGVLKDYDWSVTTPVFDLALACVRRDFSRILELAVLAEKAGVKYDEARTWAVFKEAREIDGFLDCFPASPLQIPKLEETIDT